MEIFNSFVIKIIAASIFILLNSGLIYISAYLFGLEDNEFQSSLMISIIVGIALLIVGSVPFFGWLTAVIIQMAVIFLFKKFYKFGWKMTLTLWLVWLILFLILSIIIGTVFVIF